MIEKTVMDYLKARLDVPVCMEKPEDPQERYVLIEKLGGGKENHICSASLAIQSYAESLFAAASLNEAVKVTMDGIIERDEIAGIELDSDYNFTDTAKKKYRYQAVFDLTHY